MKFGFQLTLLLLLGTWLIACSASNQDKSDIVPMVTTLAADRFCGSKSGLYLINSERQQFTLQPMSISQALEKSQIDWLKQKALRINMGQQPNMGYSLEYQGGAKIIDGRLRIPVKWNTPQPGMMYAQMLVEPCLLLSIPRDGYEAIEVVDQDGRLRGSL